MLNVKSRTPNEAGFIPLLVTILLVVAAIIYLIYTKVLHNQK
ncbi:MAG TPA: hypothetical protein VIJ68_00550 [Candidatus Saccharimonadales bacterium]